MFIYLLIIQLLMSLYTNILESSFFLLLFVSVTVKNQFQNLFNLLYCELIYFCSKEYRFIFLIITSRFFIHWKNICVILFIISCSMH